MDASLTTRAEELARQIAGEVTTVDELNGLFRSMMGSAIQAMLDAEMDHHLGRADSSEPAVGDTGMTSADPKNRRNGRSKKTVTSDLGDVTISTPRDREGTPRLG